MLRLEVGYSLYGSDIDEVTTPLEAGLAAFVNFDKEFVGREALLRQQREGLPRVKAAFRVSSRRSPPIRASVGDSAGRPITFLSGVVPQRSIGGRARGDRDGVQRCGARIRGAAIY